MATFRYDPDVHQWFIETALGEETSRDREGLQILAAATARSLPYGENIAASARQIADRQAFGKCRTRRSFLYAMAATGDGKEKSLRAATMERVVEFRDINTCRALIGGLERAQPSRREHAILRQMCSASPQLAPVVEMVGPKG